MRQKIDMSELLRELKDLRQESQSILHTTKNVLNRELHHSPAWVEAWLEASHEQGKSPHPVVDGPRRSGSADS
jgi:hypothetical protein